MSSAKNARSGTGPTKRPPTGRTVATEKRTVLGVKVGLVQDNKIIEEKQVRPGSRLSIGTDPSNTFVLLEEGIPKKHVMFQTVDKNWVGSFLDVMTGMVSFGDEVVDVRELVDKGRGTQKGELITSKFQEATKGKVSIGQSTILFRVIPIVAEVPIMELPKELKRRWWMSFDPHFLMILIISALLHWVLFTFVEQIEIQEYAKARRPDIIYERFTGPIEEIPDMTPEEEEGDEKPGGTGGTAARPSGGGSGDEDKGGVENFGVLAIITREGEGEGAIAEVLGEIGAGDLEQSFGQISGVSTYTGGEIRRGKPGGGGEGGEGTGGTVGIGNLASAGSGGAESVGSGDQKVERQVKGSVGGNVGAVSGGNLDRGVISSYVRSKMGGIRSCYERELKKNPSLKGKITVTFSIGGDGKVVGASVAGATLNDPSVQNCVLRMVRRWRFTPPEDGKPVAVTYPFVFTAVGN